MDGTPADSESIRLILQAYGYECECFNRGSTFIKALRRQDFHLLLVDWQLPDISGIELVSWVRQTIGQALPVLFLSGRSQEDAVVRGLSAGADGYLFKPVRRAEFAARVGAALRRAALYSAGPVELIRVGLYVIDPVGREIRLRGARVDLSPRVFDLALCLFRNVGRLLSRELIEQTVWGRHFAHESRTLSTHVFKLRRQLALNQDNGIRLISVYSLGYRLELT